MLLFPGHMALYVQTVNFNRLRCRVRSSGMSVCSPLCGKKSYAFQVFAVLSAGDRKADTALGAASHIAACRNVRVRVCVAGW